jgi:hypothetical protein
MKKLLVIGIIVLFIGLAFIPSFNAVSISMLENHPPYVPSNPYPDGPPVDIDVILSWDGGDPDIGDTVTYYVSVDTFPPATVGPYPANQTRIEYDPDGLIYYKEYYWHVVAEDNYGLQTEGPVWSFITIYPNHPPSPPQIKGPTKALVGTHEWKFKSFDPDGDNVSYLVDWGDSTGYNWNGPHPSGIDVTISHTYIDAGTYAIAAVANDTYGAVSDKSTLPVLIYQSKNISNHIKETTEDCDCQSNGKTHLAEKILNRLEKNELFKDIINSDNPTFERPICWILRGKIAILSLMWGNLYTVCFILYQMGFKELASKLYNLFIDKIDKSLFETLDLMYYYNCNIP